MCGFFWGLGGVGGGGGRRELDQFCVVYTLMSLGVSVYYPESSVNCQSFLCYQCVARDEFWECHYVTWTVQLIFIISVYQCVANIQ